MLRVRRLLRPRGLVIVVAACLVGTSLKAQVRFAIDSRSSLAWWQVQPHMGHLWATTCPEDPSWYAGATHSSGYRYDVKKDPTRGRGGIVPSVKDEANTPVPMFPRPSAQALCTPAVRGEIAVSDTAGWRGVRGLILVRAAALVMGDYNRDFITRYHVLQTHVYPDIRFAIDSLTDIRKGDTLQATAVGTLELHGVRKPWGIPIKAWREPLGLRVKGQVAFPAPDLIGVYQMSKYPLSLGVGTEIWKWVHLGIDVVLKPAGPAS